MISECCNSERIISLLRTPRQSRTKLFSAADLLRHDIHGDTTPVRGIVEFSNICVNDCLYCGIRRSNKKIHRYSLEDDEILAIARRMPSWQHGTIVLQAGENPSTGQDKRLGALIKRIKRETELAVTISAGNRTRDLYAFWQDCGMDRYLLRFETSSADLFAKIHPDCSLEERIDCLLTLKDLGVQTGSGFMAGLPGETDEILAENIRLCSVLNLDMIGFGPFIPSPDTPMADEKNRFENDKEMFFVILAVLRLCNPRAHIPATTAFDAIFPKVGRFEALQCGANVFMPNNTPARVRENYSLYPGKPHIDSSAEEFAASLEEKLRAIGRCVAIGPAHAKINAPAFDFSKLDT